MTTAIAYNGGSYGTYLEWCLTTLTLDSEILLPFNRNGNSHNFTKDPLSIAEYKTFNNQTGDSSFARFHPKCTQAESLFDNLTVACNVFDHVIYLYPDPSSILLCVNNFYVKIWDDWWTERTQDPVFKDNLYTGWNIDSSTPVKDIPVWIQREILSYNLMPSWFDQIGWDTRSSWSNPKSITVTVNELLYDFEYTILNLQKFCNLTFKKSIQELLPAHYTMLSLQEFLGQDQICNKILAAILNGVNMDFDDLPLPSQAWLQWSLRKHKWEIRCDGLDTFPTNSVQLKELLYPVI